MAAAFPTDGGEGWGREPTVLGGAVAFEMARQLTAEGEEVLRLFLFDAWRPDVRRGFAPEAPTARGRQRGVHKGSRPSESRRLAKTEADALLARRWRLVRSHPRPCTGRIVRCVDTGWHERNPTLGWDAVATGAGGPGPVRWPHHQPRRQPRNVRSSGCGARRPISRPHRAPRRGSDLRDR